MSDKSAKITYWAATGLVAFVYLGAGAFYISSHDMVVGMYEGLLKYPTYIIWPLAVLKVVAAVVILTLIALIVSFLTQNRVRAKKSPYGDMLKRAA